MKWVLLIAALLSGCIAMEAKPPASPNVSERNPASREIMIACDSEEKDVRVEITEEGYDRDGRKFHGKIYKKNEVIRDTDLRRTASSNEFGFYADSRGGWSFFYSGRRSAQITVESEALRKVLGAAIIVNCDRPAPRDWY